MSRRIRSATGQRRVSSGLRCAPAVLAALDNLALPRESCNDTLERVILAARAADVAEGNPNTPTEAT